MVETGRFLERPDLDKTMYSSYISPVGELLIIGTDSSLSSIIFKNIREHHPLEKKLIKGTNSTINACRSYLDLYFNNTSAAPKYRYHMPSYTIDKKKQMLHINISKLSYTIDCSLITPNEFRVYAELLKIPFGSTISYGELACRAGFPRGARFIGTTMAKNMVPIIIPCHRVIRSDGTIGNYSGGRHIKEYLLDWDKYIIQN